MKIQSNHEHSFRSGEWAELLELTIINVRKISTNTTSEPRLCFHVMFADGVQDYWPVYDPNGQYNFEMRPNGRWTRTEM